MLIEYVNRKPNKVTFDLMQGESPLIMGHDVKQYSNTVNLAESPTTTFWRPMDTCERTFFTYIIKDDMATEGLELK